MVLFAASFSVRKAPHDALLAFAATAQRFPAARLVMVGEGPLRPFIEAETVRLGLRERVTFEGHLPLDGLAQRYAESSLLLCPSLSEGLPRVVIEAMACGKPVVATAVGGIPELVEEGVRGFLVPPHDVAALADRISALLANPAKAAEMGKKAREWVKDNFSEEQFYGNYLALFRATLGQEKRTAFNET